MSNNPFENWMKSDLNKNLLGNSNLPFDMKKVMESSRKTIQAFTEAQQVAMESLQTIAQRQAEIMSQFMQDHSAIAHEIANESTPEEKISRGTDLIRRTYEKTVSNAREMNDMLNKSTREATDIINKRVASALNEIKTSAEDAKPNKAEGKKDKGNKKEAA